MLKISVEVKPNSKRPRIEKRDTVYLAWVDAPPTQGKANQRLIELLSEEFGIPKSRISIRKGSRSRIKTVTIDDE